MAPNKAVIASEWISYWAKSEEERAAVVDDESYIVNELAREQPELCWEVILEILRSIKPDPKTTTFQVLAAGPLEDLLASHGNAFIARVESRAEDDPNFKLLLGGVWQNTMPQGVWDRVQRCRGTTW